MMKDTLERAREPNLDLKKYLLNAYTHPVFKGGDDDDDDLINPRESTQCRSVCTDQEMISTEYTSSK
jgi:calcium permeable stress-gated cation channel